MRPLPQKDLDQILERTDILFREIRGANIFITGGTGFFGKWMLESLLWANDHLNLNCYSTILTRYPHLFEKSTPHISRHSTVSLLQGDVRNFRFPRGTFTHIIHAATESSEKLNPDDSDQFRMIDTIVDGTRGMLEFAKFCGAEKFLLTSSGAIYGKQPSELTHMPEDYLGGPDPVNPKSSYAEGKRLAEHLCSLYANAALRPKIARCFTFVGPHLPLDIHFAIGNFLRDAMKGGPIIVKGDGTTHRSYLYMADLTIWLWHVFLRGETMRPYNVGSCQSISIAELAHTVARQFPPGISVQILGNHNPVNPIDRYVPDTQRAKTELALEESVSLTDAINKTHNWYKTW